MVQRSVTRLVGGALALTLTLFGSGAVSAEEPAAPPDDGNRMPYTIAAAAGTVLYTPLKGALCFAGGIASGFAFLNAGPRAMRAVASAACKGKWLLTPGVLQGTDEFGFVGEIDQTPGH
jgi:hypothetical protein